MTEGQGMKRARELTATGLASPTAGAGHTSIERTAGEDAALADMDRVLGAQGPKKKRQKKGRSHGAKKPRRTGGSERGGV
jgi:hypothetical protein